MNFSPITVTSRNTDVAIRENIRRIYHTLADRAHIFRDSPQPEWQGGLNAVTGVADSFIDTDACTYNVFWKLWFAVFGGGFLLLEDGGFLLQEGGDKIILEYA